MKFVLSIVCLLAFASIASAQDSKDTELPAAQSIQSNPTAILMLVNESTPNQVIVYDESGEWLSSIREIKLTIDLLGTGIQAQCVSWKGVLRPSSPKEFKTKVREIKSITAEDFEARLSKLNN